MTIRYISFGIENGLFNMSYTHADHQNFTKHLGDAVLVHNKAFLDTLKEQNKSYTSVYAFLYSNRQSYEVDLANQYQEGFKGSAFSAIETVCNDLDIIFDSFLLADLYNNLPYGTAFAKALAEVKNGNDLTNPDSSNHPYCPSDRDKVPLLFAQMQKAAIDAAAKYPDEEIIFDVFDSHKHTLDYTKSFFSENKHLIPKGMTLNLNYYDGGTPSFDCSIEGEGVVYLNYAKHTIELLNQGFLSREDYVRSCIHPESPKTLLNIVAQYFARHQDLYEAERVPEEVTERVRSACRELGLDEIAFKDSETAINVGLEAQGENKNLDNAGDCEQAPPAELPAISSQTSLSTPGRSQYGFYAAGEKEEQEQTEPSKQKCSSSRFCIVS
ncbi:hypothetical protein [Legionella sp. WA2022007384]